MTRLYRVFNTHDHPTTVHEYDIIKTTNDEGHEEITLFRSFNDVWDEHSKGDEVIKIIDTGDGYVFPKKLIHNEVDYCLGAELYIIMAFINKTGRMPLFKGTIEEVVIKNNIEI